MNLIEILKAVPADAPMLTQIALEAKRHWRYPESWIQFWKSSLSVSPDSIIRNEVHKAVRAGEIIGFYTLERVENRVALIDMWVLPKYIGSGVGRHLFAHAVKLARSLGVVAMDIESDPNAEGFYVHMGACRIGTIASEVEGHMRELPFLRLDLTH